MSSLIIYSFYAFSSALLFHAIYSLNILQSPYWHRGYHKVVGLQQYQRVRKVLLSALSTYLSIVYGVGQQSLIQSWYVWVPIEACYRFTTIWQKQTQTAHYHHHLNNQQSFLTTCVTFVYHLLPTLLMYACRRRRGVLVLVLVLVLLCSVLLSRIFASSRSRCVTDQRYCKVTATAIDRFRFNYT